jgi:hypothetical protein
MGYYMNGFGEGNLRKAAALIDLHGAVRDLSPEFVNPNSGKVSVCVVNNGMFDAVAIAHTKEEFNEFNEPSDSRAKMFLRVDRKIAEEFCPQFKEYMGDIVNANESNPV